VRPRTSGALFVMLLLTGDSAASAEAIRVSGTIQRPMWQLPTSARDRFMQSTLRWVPASHQMVHVYQPRKSNDLVVGKIYCGTVWTDSNGSFDEDLICGDGNLPDQLYMEVFGTSARGFSVGAFDRVKFDLEAAALGGAAALGALFVSVGTFGAGTIAVTATALGVGPEAALNLFDRSPSPYVWVGAVEDVRGRRHAFGTFRLGRGRRGDLANSDDYAAAVMEGVDYAHAELVRPRPKGVPAAAPWRWSSWIINNPYFGSPTTIWDKVHINPGVTRDSRRTHAQNLDASWAHNMSAIVHELGHVVYNNAHSSKEHYVDPNEAILYAQIHDLCTTNISEKFGQYEGFAEAVSQAVWRTQTYRVDSAAPCRSNTASGSRPGFENEGNVADFYTSMIHGFGNPRGTTSLHEYTSVPQGANLAFLPPLDALLAMPRFAGAGSHSLTDMWNKYWRLLCEKSPTASTPVFCGTERFRCWVANTSRLAPSSELPAAFRGLSCGPDAVSSVGVTTISANPKSSSNDVRFQGADHAESYSIRIRLPPGGVRTIATTTASATGISLAPCQRHSIEVTAINTFGSATSTPVEFMPGTDAVCGPGAPSVRSATFSHDEADLLEARLVMFEILHERSKSTGKPADQSNPTPFEQRLAQLLTAARRCYRIELNIAPGANRYSVRYRPRTATAKETVETPVTPDRTQSICLEWGTRYIVNGVGHNDYGTTSGPDYSLDVPYRTEIAQVKGRVILPP
jgi:hypothetical protein